MAAFLLFGSQKTEIEPTVVWCLFPGVLTDCGLGKWVALKMLKTADRTKSPQELQNLGVLNEQSMLHSDTHHIVQLQDDFMHDGPNEHHQCLVLELNGPTVRSIVNGEADCGDRLEMNKVLRIVTQLLEAVPSMHQAGYSHGGICTDSLSEICSKLILHRFRCKELGIYIWMLGESA